MKHLRAIAVAQTIPVRGDVDANVEEHLRLTEVAASEHAEVLVVPELSLTGYELDLAHGLAFSEQDDPRLLPLVESASSTRVTLVVGAPVRVGAHHHIGAFIVSPDRSVALYTKQRLGAFPGDVNPGGAVPPAEWTVFEPGDRNPLIEFEHTTAAVAVCADTGAPEHAEAAAGRGATVYLASMFFTPTEVERETARLRGYAERHAMAVALANYGGPTGGLPAGGGSAIWSQTGELLVKLDGSGSGVAVAVENETGWRSGAHMVESVP